MAYKIASPRKLFISIKHVTVIQYLMVKRRGLQMMRHKGKCYIYDKDYLGSWLPVFYTAELHHKNLSLRTSTAPHFAITLTQTEIGKCAICLAASTIWNRLCLFNSLAIFKHRLKSTLLNSVLNSDSTIRHQPLKSQSTCRTMALYMSYYYYCYYYNHYYLYYHYY